MRTRNGKIARLPLPVREELNQRLERSEPSPDLLAWLNARPEAQKLLQKEFAGEPISKQNLSQWRQGGYLDWLARQDLWAGVQNLEDFSQDLEEQEELVIADRLTTVLTARFAALISKWDGECTPEFEAKAKVLNGLCRSVVQLQRQMHKVDHDNTERERQVAKEEEAAAAAERIKPIQQLFDILKINPLAEMFGGGVLGKKIAKYILAVKANRMDSEDAQFNVLPTDKFSKEVEREAKTLRKASSKRKRRRSKPVKVSHTIARDSEPCGEPVEPPAEPASSNSTANLPTAPQTPNEYCAETESEGILRP